MEADASAFGLWSLIWTSHMKFALIAIPRSRFHVEYHGDFGAWSRCRPDYNAGLCLEPPRMEDLEY